MVEVITVDAVGPVVSSGAGFTSMRFTGIIVDWRSW